MTVVELPGGVSSTTIAVSTPDKQLVVKQALPRLKVADEWLANMKRSVTEGRALAIWNELLPGTSPQLLDTDEANFTLALSMAPSNWRSWRAQLEDGQIDLSVASGLAGCLAHWHSYTSHRPDLLDRFDDPPAFEETRVDPYHRTVMARVPAAAAAVSAYVEQMAAQRTCLIHGDYSPKNVLVGDQQFWVLDFEVANRGDPAFDVAFMTHHLLLEAIRQPALAIQLLDAALSFWDAYYNAIEPGLAPEPSYAVGHTACLMLARVDGKSRITGLTEHQMQVARSLSLSLLAAPPSNLSSAGERMLALVQ